VDVKIQCAGLVLKQETPTAEQQQYVAHVPPAPPGETQQSAVGGLVGALREVPVGDDLEWYSAVKTILERIATKQRLDTLQ
jgi:hypothetical protein